MLTIQDLFDLNQTIAAPLFSGKTFPWEVLGEIESYIRALGPTLPASEYDHPSEDVWIAKDAEIFASAEIHGPCIIDHGAHVRHCAFIRGNAIVGQGCVVGNSTELKNVVLFNGVEVPHYNYVGDSILGYKAHMGAGAVTSNVKSDRKDVWVHDRDTRLATGRRKVGAFLGTQVEVGCNSVLNPGTVIGHHTIVYPTSCVRGVIPANHIYKCADVIVPREER